jgi:hypothetical protein
MKTLMFASVAAAGLVLSDVGLSDLGSSAADAAGFGIHVAGPGYHFDIGNRHGHHRSHRSHRSFHGHGGHGFYGWGGGHAWHDTSHYDYHPGHLVPHYDHYDYVPGHYDFHRSGHVDHLHW